MSHEHSTFDAIAAIIESISGVSVSDLNRDTDLLDLGLDSLMFVRIGRVLESTYRVDISMKRFYDELSGLGTLADFLAVNGTAQETDPSTPSGEPAGNAVLSQQNISGSLPDTGIRPGDSTPAAQPRAPSLTTPVSATGADINTVMSAHMALMRRYLDGAAAGRYAADQAPPVVRGVPAAVTRQAAASGDAIETRKKFSGIDTQKEELSTQQRNFIEKLSARLSARCRRSKQMAEEGREYLSDWKYSLQFKQDLKELRFPIVCETASGSRFMDVDGNEYVDIAMGMGVHYFGHSPRFIDDAVRAQLDRNLALGPQSRLAPDVARRICELTGHQRAAFFVTGSDAVMLAMRLVRAARGRDKVVMFAGAYHGICSDVLAGQGESGAVPMSPGLPAGIVDDLVVLDYDAPESLDRIRELADHLAGVLVEPVQSRNPALQPQRFLRQLRALCTELEIPLIFDEMVNGFRQAAGGMQEWFGVKADMSTYGKIIGGGYPLSVIAGNADLMQWIDGGVWHFGDDSAPLTDSISTGGTHNKHPVALAAAAAVLDHIENNPQLFQSARMRMHQLADRINVWFERHAVPLRLTYFGTQFKFESFASALELELFFYLLLEKGVYTWELHVANLSTEHTQEDADHLFAAIVHAVESLRAGGFGFRAAKLRRQYVPMSSVQKRLYAVTQREGAEKPYHLAGAWRLQGKVDADRLEDCIHQVIIRHESLRTAFVVVDGEFYQRIVAEPRFFLDHVDVGDGNVEELLDNYIQPFNLLEPPLLRVALAAQADGCHLLLMDVHHIVADGLSMNVVLQEILALYDGASLDPVRSQARHVQDAIDQYLDSDRAREAARYWQEALAPLADSQQTFDLSPDFSRPPVTSFAGKRIALKLDTDATAALHRFCTNARVSTFGALFAVFVAWTWRYARQQHFVVGLPGSGRPDAAADNAVGMFVNTLAFPASVDEQSSVAAFLQQIRDRLFEVQEHADYPFSSVISALNIGHRANRNPLFDVMFSYENAGSRVIKTDTFAGETLTQYEGAGMFDISFDLIEAEGSILINCAYAESLFSDITMRRRLDEYLALLKLLVAGEATTVADWTNAAASSPGTQASARAASPATRPVAAYAATVADTDTDTVCTLWDKQVVGGAQNVALIDGKRTLTYAELDHQIRETAFTLFNLYGVRAGDRVLVSLDSSADLVVVMLSLFSMGAVYVPVTPDTPLPRLRLIQQQCDARYLIHAAGHNCVAELRAAEALECIAMEAIRESVISAMPHQTLQPPCPDDVAYVIFTSGSTGVPKGVEICHAGIVNSVAWRIQSYHMGQADTTLQMPSAGFDASVIDILSALLSGGSLVMLDTASKRSVECIGETIGQHKVTSILLTPTLYRVLLDRIPRAMASLRFITLAGEKLPPDLMQAHFAQAPNVELWNEYGPTECSVVVSGGRLEPGQDRVNIGWPVNNVQVHILDEQERPTPTGVWGRLWVSGIGLAKGYAGDETNTYSKFRCLPALDNLRCYDTGDIVRLLDNGALEFKGRDDGQVKVNGNRIELEDVESALRSQLDLSEVAASVVATGTSARLHGWIVTDAEPTGWRDALMSVLPVWMVPGTLHVVSQLPLLPSGKLDRGALVPPPEKAGPFPDTETTQAVPVTACLEQLLSHCREVLGRPDLKPGDNYFNAGGDSIQAIVLASRLNEAGYLLDINDLFRNPVLSELARRIEVKGSQRKSVLHAAETALPTPMQAWFFETCKGDADAFTQAAWVRLPDRMTLAQLDTLCRHWASQHSVFREVRALIADRDGRPQPDTANDAVVHCSEADTGWTPDAVAESARGDIRLQGGPLLRVVLVHTEAESKALVAFHHFVVDAVSWKLLQTQWAQLWEDIGEKHTLRTLPASATMRQFASALHDEDARHKALLEVPFWKSVLADARTVLGAGNPDQIAEQSARQQRLHLAASLDAEVAEILLATGHQYFRSRGSDLLLAAFTEAVARVFELDVVTVLMESNGRAQRYADADFSTTLGWMTSAYPLSIVTPDAGPDGDWTAKLERIRERTQRVPEQGVGYGVLRYVLRHEALSAFAPEFAFNYLGRFKHHPDNDFAILDESPAGDRMGELGLLPPLEFVCFADDAGLHVSLSADAALVGQDTLASILTAFRQQAQDLVSVCRKLTAPVALAPVDFVEADWSLDDYLGLLRANAVERGDVDNLLPITAMQSGLIYHARSKPDDLAYLEQVDFTLHGVDADKLATAFQRLLVEFPLLRAAFVVGSNGRTAQLIRTQVTLPVVCHDLSTLSSSEQQRVIDEARAADQLLQFDIKQPPLMRVQLFTLQKPQRKRKTQRKQKSDPTVNGKVHVIWTHHHLIMDGWCVGILFDSLLSCYAETDAPATDIIAADATHDRLNLDYFRWLASRDRDTTAGYWSTLLAGVERATRLLPWPQPDTSSADTSYQLQRHTVQLSARLATDMQAWGASHNATISSVIRLAWAVLLARFTNSADVVYGTVVSGRPPEIAGIDRAVGLFINTVPVRFQLVPGMTANDALVLVQQQANAGRSHEYLSLAEIQAAAPDLLAREPLFDHLVVLENYPMDAALRGSGESDNAATVGISDIRAFERTDLPLNLVIVPSDGGLEATFMFDASVYPARQIEHLAEHFAHLAQALVQTPDQALTSLDLLTVAESSWLSDQWNGRQSAYPTHTSLFALYQQAVNRHGDRVALRDDLGSISYAELNANVQRVAAGLLQSDAFASGRRVALWLPRNRDMIVGMLAVLAAGGSYVALDPIYPEERLRFIVEDSGAALVLTTADMPAVAFAVNSVDVTDMASATDEPVTLPALTPDTAAYVIYTSGSTGQPKGCEISHRNVVRLLRNEDFDFDFDHNDVWVLAHSFCFDFSVWEMYGALVNGGTLVIPAATEVRNVESFAELVARNNVTVLNQTPAAFYQFSKAVLKKQAASGKAGAGLAALRLVVFGGDALACNRLQTWVDAFPTSRVKLVNMYGITETTVHVSYREVNEEDIINGSRLNLVGRPLPETRVWIVDRYGQLQPPGIAGEIVVGGSGVGMGYLNRPELTARKFASLEAAGKERCYWSGDVGYISMELGLVYQGRNDHQVQVRGFRVECEEIARCLEMHQSVAEALVIATENTHGTELVAYLVGDETAAPVQWRPWLSTRVPDYMIPSYTLWLNALPMTTNGKIDRAALPDPFSVVTAPETEPADDVEANIISAWQQVLEHEKVDSHTNFFDVGGHSLKALTLVDVLQTRFGLSLGVADVFEFPTPRQQATLCQANGAVASPPADDIDAVLSDIDVDDLDLDALEALLADVTDKGQGR
ncbi:non-ribosomal peptide synthetase [Pseudohongiella sp.]|uniref:Carrier domain-containing protein n=1 Tax=marine sediment metagenome TaxID=412755 RepID=A0A0F9W8V1_9ZZZZ|nr:non-ribosomal peptide synthetase [Pseudohongiella sp.]HDZ08111.1 amino acid adenylation domain-containing protein [Pseudohongiella sp.]HEA63079.1 amino acid adenylation domain-containing protein [Pseudohongiella sp.]